MLDSLSKPVVFAHRGSCKYAPENTLAAFSLAIEQEADAIELDVQLSSDKEVVVFHDQKLDRTTNGKGDVKDHTFDTLKALNAGILFGPAYPNESIPSLSQVFENFGDTIYYNIELKNLSTPFDDLPGRVVDIIKRYQLEDHVLLSSFNPIALIKIDKIIPGLPKGILLSGRFSRILHPYRFFPFLDYQSVHFSFESMSLNQIQTIHTGGKLAFTYTLNNPADIISSLNLGIDGFFTDDPVLARKTILTRNYQ